MEEITNIEFISSGLTDGQIDHLIDKWTDIFSTSFESFKYEMATPEIKEHIERITDTLKKEMELEVRITKIGNIIGDNELQ